MLRTQMKPHARALWLAMSVALAGGGVVVARSEVMAHARLAGTTLSIAGCVIAILVGNRERYQGLRGCATGCVGAIAGAAVLGTLAVFENRRTRGSPLPGEHNFGLIPIGILFGSILGAAIALSIMEVRSARVREHTPDSEENFPT